MILTELFDRTYPYKVTGKSNSQWTAEFETANNLIRFKANGYEDEWEVIFSGGTENERSYDTLGSGDAFKIMGTIVKIMKDFVQQTSPRVVMFSGSWHDGHAKLYDRMLNNVDVPGYTKTARDSLNVSDRLFKLVRNQNEAA